MKPVTDRTLWLVTTGSNRDGSRPVQYEQAGRRAHTDIVCPMYADLNWMENFAKSGDSRPLIQCEYAHAMGNSLGGF